MFARLSCQLPARAASAAHSFQRPPPPPPPPPAEGRQPGHGQQFAIFIALIARYSRRRIVFGHVLDYFPMRLIVTGVFIGARPRLGLGSASAGDSSYCRARPGTLGTRPDATARSPQLKERPGRQAPAVAVKRRRCLSA